MYASYLNEYYGQFVKPLIVLNLLKSSDLYVTSKDKNSNVNGNEFTVLIEWEWVMQNGTARGDYDFRKGIYEFLEYLTSNKNQNSNNMQVILLGSSTFDGIGESFYHSDALYINPLNNNVKNFDINIKYKINDFDNVIDSLNLIYDNQIFGSKQRFLYFSGMPHLLRLNDKFVGNKVNITKELWNKSHYVLLPGLRTITTAKNDDILVRLIDFVKEWKNYCVENESNNSSDYETIDWTFEYLKTIAQSGTHKFNKFRDLIICNKHLECCCDNKGNLKWKVV